MTQDPLSLRRLRTWLRLLRVTRNAENHLREFLRVNYDTTLPRFDVAAALYRSKEPMKMSELSKMLLVSNGNVTNIVDRLELEDKAQRVTHDTDRRVVFVELTPAGREWFQKVAAAHEQEVNKVFSNLGHAELTQLRDLLRIAERNRNDQVS